MRGLSSLDPRRVRVMASARGPRLMTTGKLPTLRELTAAAEFAAIDHEGPDGLDAHLERVRATLGAAASETARPSVKPPPPTSAPARSPSPLRGLAYRRARRPRRADPDHPRRPPRPARLVERDRPRNLRLRRRARRDPRRGLPRDLARLGERVTDTSPSSRRTPPASISRWNRSASAPATARAEHTWIAYAGHWKRFSTWYELRGHGAAELVPSPSR